MFCYKLILFSVLLQATMGLSPLLKDCKQTHCFDAQRRASLMVAAALFVSTACPVPSVALSLQDKKDVTEIVMASEKRTTEIVMASEKRTNARLTEISNKFELVPYVSVGVATLGSVYSSNKLDDALDRFSEQKENIKKDLESGTQEKARNGTIIGGLVVLGLTGGGAAYAFAVVSMIHSP